MVYSLITCVGVMVMNTKYVFLTWIFFFFFGRNEVDVM